MPILTPDILDFTSHSAEQTARIGTRLGGLLAAGDVICLSGDLGAGKTVLAAGIGKGWGALEPVNSPTFVFVHEHRRRRDDERLNHVDCYRLSGVEDVDTIGIDEILMGNDIAVIEWPERIESLLPEERLWIHLSAFDDFTEKRQLQFRATGKHYQQLLVEFRRKAFGA